MMINYGQETTKALANRGYTVFDIDWIGTHDFTISVEEFFKAAYNTNYNNSYGCVATPMDIVIVMKDGNWFERSEYDGSEWWAYKRVYTKPMIHLHMQQDNFEYHGYMDPLLHLYCVKINE